MTEGLTDVRAISKIAYAFMGSKALFAALDLNLFDLMSHKPLSLQSLSDTTGVAPNRLATLLVVLQSLGIVVRQGDLFANAPATQKYLVRTSETFFGDYYRLQIDKIIYPQFMGLADGLRGNPPQSMRDMLADPAQAALFTDAQHQGSMGPAVLLSRSVDLSGRRKLLDVAGGSGAFSIVLCRRYQGLNATMIDFPSVVEVASRFVIEAGLEDRIALLGGDALEVEWPPNQDVVLMSYLLSAVGSSDIPRLLRAALGALAPAGILIIHDFMLDMEHAGPPEASQFFLSYIAQRTDSVSFSGSDLAEASISAGFKQARAEPLIAGLTGIVVADK